VVKLHDADDYVPKTGTMQVYLSPWTGDSRFVTVTVDNGKWKCTSAYDGKGLAIGRMQLDGREAYSQESSFESGGERFIALEAQWLEPTHVHVVDRINGKDVMGARVRSIWGDADGNRGPGRIFASGDGRFLFDPWRMWMMPGAYKEGCEVWVEAPGYEPHIQFFNPWQGGDWTVEL
jgi:hypothetical protein